MKKVLLTTLLFLVSFSLAQTVDEILDKVEANEEAKSAKIEMTQIVYTASGEERKSNLLSYSKDKGDKGLMEYLKPARIKGMKILMLNDGDDIWLYSPRTSRVRKIASHQKNQSVNGSDFSYDDMSAKDMRKDYNPQLLGEEELEGKKCFKLLMTAKDEDKTYSKSISWIDKSNYVLVKSEMYDEDKKLWKVLKMSDVSKVGNYWTPKSIEMKNVQKGSRTLMTMDKIEYDLPLKDNIFSERNLKR
ncbi:MAG: outer membrane lipoprotein-sorting protein [Fibrobacteria bacterium]|nr:outer membrane lipoprotein-sorting protein [Fibrobacteria bacterium]